MNMGEPVVGWIEPGPLRKEATATTVVAMLTGTLGILIFLTDDTWMRLAGSGLLVLFGGVFGWFAALYWRTLRNGWGALQARLDRDAVVLGTPFSMSVGRGTRFASRDRLTLSVRTVTVKRRLISEWRITGTGATVMAKSLGVWTEEQRSELVEGLQRLGFTVVAEA